MDTLKFKNGAEISFVKGGEPIKGSSYSYMYPDPDWMLDVWDTDDIDNDQENDV